MVHEHDQRFAPAFQGVEDRLDGLPQRLEEPGVQTFQLAFAGRADEPDAGLGQLVLEVASVLAFVAQQCRAGHLSAVEQRGRGMPFVGLRAGERPRDRQLVEGGHQVQPQPPEESGVGGGVPVLGVPGQLGAVHGLAGSGALHGGGVRHPHVVGGHRGRLRQCPDQPVQSSRGRELAQPLVVPGLARQVREQAAQPGAREADEQRLADVPRSACITESVTSSASVIRGAIPTFGRAGRRSGYAFIRSSAVA